MTEVGKTSLALNALTETLKNQRTEDSGAETSPVLFIVVGSSGQNSLSWRRPIPPHHKRSSGVIRFSAGQRLSHRCAA